MSENLLLGMILAMATLATAISATPRGVPEPIAPLPFGVNIHFKRAPRHELYMLAEGGFRFIRMDFFWEHIEKQRGVYDFSDYDVLVRDMTERGIRILFILDYGNPLYDNGMAPYTDEGRAAFARFASAAAKRYAGKGILWEIWNEPNISFWRPKPNVEDYAKMTMVVIDAVRKADPNAFIVGPASSGFPWDFMETLGQRGVLAKLDAVTVHPYRQQIPETAEQDYRPLRLLLDRYSPRKHLPILSGEWGYSDVWRGMDMQKQGRYLPRQWLSNLASDVFLSIWYDWKNDGTDPKEPEHHFGTVTHDLRPKPAYVSAKTLTSTLGGYRYLRRIALPNPGDYLLLFRKGEDLALAAWTTGDPHPVTLNLPRGSVRIVEMTGKTRNIAVSDAPFVLDLSGNPQYVLIPTHIDLQTVGAWSPVRQVITVRAGATQNVPVNVANPSSRALSFTLRVRKGNAILGQTRARLQAGQQRVINVPVKIDERSEEYIRATVEWVGEKASPLQTATVWLCLSNALKVDLLPPSGRRILAVVQNPSGEALSAALQVEAGGQKSSAPIQIARGEREARVVVEMPQKLPSNMRMSAHLVDNKGTVLARAEGKRWVVLDAVRPNLGWRAWVDGDANVEGKAEVHLAEAPEPAPSGTRSAIRLDYRFAKGWRFACTNLPQEAVAIEGKPKAVGMWVYGDGSGNMLRCRITDSTGQTFQPNYGPITWKGWRFVTMRLDGGFPGFWGGANDGVVHYPIRWEAVVLVDSNQQSADRDWSIYVTDIALEY